MSKACETCRFERRDIVNASRGLRQCLIAERTPAVCWGRIRLYVQRISTHAANSPFSKLAECDPAVLFACGRCERSYDERSAPEHRSRAPRGGGTRLSTPRTFPTRTWRR